MATESFNVQRKKLGLVSNNAATIGYLRGKRVKVTRNTGGHNYGAAGTVFTVEPSAYISSSGIASAIAGGNTILFTEFTVITDYTEKDIKEQIDSLKKQKKELDSEISVFEARLKFMKAHGLDKFDEDEFKVFSTLDALEDAKTSKMEKAKIIAKLIKG